MIDRERIEKLKARIHRSDNRLSSGPCKIIFREPTVSALTGVAHAEVMMSNAESIAMIDRETKRGGFSQYMRVKR